MLVQAFLRKFIRSGTPRLKTADGKQRVYQGTEDGPSITLCLHKRSLEWTLAFAPDPRFGEAYMDGDITIEDGDLRDFMWLVNRNEELARRAESGWLEKLVKHARRWQHLRRLINPPSAARKKVSHHYDLTGDLFRLFLDEDQQYSCAYFSNPNESLEAAQERKKRRLAAKLLLEPDQKVLDIGSGWGGLGLYIDDVAGCDVTGLTLSHEQHAVSQRRALDAGVDDKVRFELRDYRHVEGTFDRIVSVGIFEHVGLRHYQEFFDTASRLLKPDGVGVLHSIGRYNAPEPISPWVEKYIFPGSYTPSLSEVLPKLERARLWVTDVEIMRVHYAETLKKWHERFMKNRDKALRLYDERFCRMWEFYLTGCEMAFRAGSLMVFQIQFAKDREAVPLTRDYVEPKEREIETLRQRNMT